MITIDASAHGPIFDGKAPAIVAEFLRDAQEEVAAQALADVHQILNERIKHPTPYYETQIISQRLGADMVVHDRGIVYGPWLEGTGSRNATTSFKGYHAFRTARDNLVSKVPGITQHVLQKYLPRLEG